MVEAGNLPPHQPAAAPAATPSPVALPNVAGALAGLPGVAAVEWGGRADAIGLYVLAQDGVDLLTAVRDLVAHHGVVIAELRLERGRLDGVFRDITMVQN